jgi:hypothetical protein
MSMTDDRPLTLRRLAARVATHQRIQTAVVGAIQAELPSIIEELLGAMADDAGGTLRLYRRKRPKAKRIERDNQIRALLGGGILPRAVAEQVKCSLAHVYTIRQQWQAHAASAAPEETPETCAED